MAILAASEAIATSKQPQRSLLISKLYSVALISLSSVRMPLIIAILMASEAIETSKQPRRSLLTSNFNSVASITFVLVSS